MTMRLSAAVAAALTTVAMPASAAVLDFDNFKPVNQDATNITSIYGPIVEDGFRISSSTCEAPSGGRPVGRCFTTMQRRRSIDTVGAAIQSSFAGQTVTVEQLDGSAFLFESIDIGSNQGSNALNIDFRYTLASGVTGLSSFTIPTLNQLLGATYSLAALGPLTSISFDPQERNGTFQFDNIRVSAATAAVPEPAAWAMMIAGFGLVGGAARRRTVRVAIA